MKDIITIVVFLAFMYIGFKIDGYIIAEIMNDLSPADQYYNIVFYGLWMFSLMILGPIILWVSIIIAGLVNFSIKEF